MRSGAVGLMPRAEPAGRGDAEGLFAGAGGEASDIEWAGALIARRRVLDAVRLGLGAGLVVLDAPAGWGKSVLLRQLKAELGDTASWVRPPATLLPPQLGDTRSGVAPRATAAGAGPAAKRDPGSDHPAFQAAEDRSRPWLVALVDDVDVLEKTEQGSAFLEDVIASMQEGQAIVLAGRRISHRSVTHRLAGGSGLLLTRRDLRFDEGEAQQLASAAGLPDAAGEVLRESEGWPSGTAAAVGVLRPDLAWPEGEWAAYLDSEVLGTDEELCRALEVLNLLPTVGAAVGEALVGRQTYAAVHELLDSEIPAVMEAGGRWRLQRQLRTRLLARSRGGSRWSHVRRALQVIGVLREQSLHVEALGTAVQEGLCGAAMAILNDHGEDELWTGPHRVVADAVDMLRDRRGQVPLLFDALWAESVVDHSPTAALRRATAVLDNNPLDPIVQAVASKAALAACRLAGSAGLAATHSRRLQSLIGSIPRRHARHARLEIARHFLFDRGDAKASIGLLRACESSLTQGEKDERGHAASHGRYEVVARIAAGDLDYAVERGERVLDDREGAPQSTTDSVSNNLALAYAVMGDRYRSTQLALGVALETPARARVGVAHARATLAEIMLMQGRPAVASELLARWFGTPEPLGQDPDVPPRLVPLVLSLRAACDRDRGKPRRAVRRAEEALRIAVLQNGPQDSANCAIELARCLLAAGQPGSALSLLEPIIEHCRRTGEGLALRPATLVAGLAACEAHTSEDGPFRTHAVAVLNDKSTWPSLLPILIQHASEREVLLRRSPALSEQVSEWVAGEIRVNTLLGEMLDPFLDIHIIAGPAPQIRIGRVELPKDVVLTTRLIDSLVWIGRREGPRPYEFLLEDLRWAVYRDLGEQGSIQSMISDLTLLHELAPEGAVERSRATVTLHAVIDVVVRRSPVGPHSSRQSLTELDAAAHPVVADLLRLRVGDPAGRRVQADQPEGKRWPQIPPRLRRVLPYLITGMLNRSIGERLGLSEHTVENYVSELLRITGQRTRTSLAVAAVEAGFRAAPPDREAQ